MERTNFWNDALKYGAIIGGLLAASAVMESTMTLKGMYGIMILEWFAVVILHYYLLHRFTRNRSNLYSAEEGFSFGIGYGYIISMSVVAGFITGVVQYIYLHFVIGYENYITKVIASLNRMMSQEGVRIPANMEPYFTQSLAQLENTPEPSFLSSAGDGVWTSLLFGAIFGLIIAGVCARQPRPFAMDETDKTE